MLNQSDSNQLLEHSLSDKYQTQKLSSPQQDNLLWKKNDRVAQKNGRHSAIYWVKKQQKNEDGSDKQSKWVANTKYIGEWLDNRKTGFGIQFYGNGDKYEGGWETNMRNGQGTYWVCEGKNKLRREYTGDWQNDKKTGRGTMFYKNGNRYDGLWIDDKPHGEGRMIYANGDVYEGMWFMGKRSGYGVLTKRNGDHFEGHWVNDKREGQGSYFFSSKNQVFVGEWVDDSPKTGVYSEVEDPYQVKPEREKHFTDPYILPQLPQIELKNPTNVLQASMEGVRRHRTIYRARFIPLDELYTKEELHELINEFGAAVNDKKQINIMSVQAILLNMNFELQEYEIDEYLKKLKPDYQREDIDFDLFARLIAVILEEASYNNDKGQQQQQQDMQLDDQDELMEVDPDDVEYEDNQ